MKQTRSQRQNLLQGRRRCRTSQSENRPPSNTDFSKISKKRQRSPKIFKLRAASPPKKVKRARAVRTRTVSTQTSSEQFFVAKQVPHASLLQLQLDANLTDTQMRKITHLIRTSTEVNRIIAPNYEPYLTQLHRLFADLYHVVSYKCPVTGITVPLVVCADTSQLLHRIQQLHQRQIRQIHFGVDSGKFDPHAV